MRSFRTRLLLFFLVVTCVPLLVAGYVLIESNGVTTKRLSLEIQLSLAEGVGEVMRLDLRDAGQELDELIALILTQNAADDADSKLANAVGASQRFDAVYVTDASGKIVEVVAERAARERSRIKLSADQLNRCKTTRLGVGTPTEANSGVRVPLCRPLKADGHLVGFLVGEYWPYQLPALLHDWGERRLGSSGRLAVVGHSSAVLARSHSDWDPDLKRFGGPDAAFAGASGESESKDGAGLIATQFPISGTPFLVFVEVSRDEAYATYERSRRTFFATLGVAVMFAFIGALIAAGVISRPINLLAAHAKELSRRAFGFRNQIRSPDEIGTLATALNDAGHALATSEEQLLREERVRSQLGRYLPQPLVEHVVEHAGGDLPSRKVDLVVMFVDIVGFTPLTRDLGAETVVELLGEFFGLLTDIVQLHGGMVDKFLGDGAMVLFGVTGQEGNPADESLLSADQLMRWLDVANTGWKSRFGAHVDIAIGIHAGEAVFGNVGSEARVEYTAVGDTVNVASRIEQSAQAGHIVVSSELRETASSNHLFVPVGMLEDSDGSERALFDLERAA